MDGLSLLCNLHAEGPVTLRWLREAGVQDLPDLEGVPESTLATWLHSSAAHARRFVEEARHLGLRLAEAPLEPEPGTPEREVPHEVPHEVTGDSLRTEAARVWRSWASVATAHSAARALDPARTLLRAGLFAGLDAQSCERLAENGVRSVEDLVQGASLALARRSGIRYTKLLELEHLARAHLAGPSSEIRPASVALELVPEPLRRALTSPTEDRQSASTVARVSAGFHRDPGVAGPFG